MGAYDYLIKLMLIGDSGVGKSSLLTRFTMDAFDAAFTPTIGIDFKLRTIELDGKRIKLQFLDTAGQERFRTITTAHYRNAQGVMLVYDITSEASFRNIEGYVQRVEQCQRQPFNKILIGNRGDLSELRKVTPGEGKNLADQLGMKFFETSSKTNTNVEEAFLEVAREVVQRFEGHATSSSARTETLQRGRTALHEAASSNRPADVSALVDASSPRHAPDTEMSLEERLSAIGINDPAAAIALRSAGVCSASALRTLTPSEVGAMQTEHGLKLMPARKIITALKEWGEGGARGA